MKILITTVLCVLLYLVTIAQSPVIEWQKTIGGDAEDAVFSAIQTTDGGYLLGGYSSSGISGEKSDSSRGGADYWIVKLDETGNVQWDKTYGGDSTDYLQVVLQTQDGGYMLGGYTYSSNTGDKSDTAKGGWDTWLIKTDAAGNIEWDKSYGGDEKDGLVSMRQTEDGGYLFWAVSKTDANGDKTEASRGSSDYWIVKIDDLGNVLWDKTIGSANIDHILSLLETSDGGYLLGGFSFSKKGGEKTAPSFGFWDYWLVKLDNERNIEWDRSYGGTSSDHLISLQEMKSGGYLLGGFSSSDSNGNKTEPNRGIFDYWILQIDASGNKIWGKSFGGASSEEMRAGVQYTKDGNLILGGFSQSGISGEKSDISRGKDDYWLIKADSTGQILWDKTIGGSGTEFLYSVVPTVDNGLLVAGWSNSPISGEKADSSRGDFDFWIVKLGSDTGTNTLNLSKDKTISVHIYPNPFAQTAIVQIVTTRELSGSISFILFNEMGESVYKSNAVWNNMLQINRGDIPSGVYYYTVNQEGIPIAHGKLIIQ